ncbi:MAG: hypothetical protein F4201_05060 [Nitrospira sp. SB0677_bin_15]|nr:hypothetical protein [Nitrospira sp. SB0661_bin_20]MYG40172.1 hypothetical protein [Nitrospira sp. SB0677_bin_15]MYH03169.1 hypothetical protein [Nitrospira sp. SB0675_bin_23]
MISSYYYKGVLSDEWEFQETELNNINLIVGASGSGKTRYLNTIFNVSSSIVHGQPFRHGYWKLTVKTGKYEYLWEYDGGKKDNGENQIEKELVKRKSLGSQEKFENLIDRTSDTFFSVGKNCQDSSVTDQGSLFSKRRRKSLLFMKPSQKYKEEHFTMRA